MATQTTLQLVVASSSSTTTLNSAKLPFIFPNRSLLFTTNYHRHRHHHIRVRRRIQRVCVGIEDTEPPFSSDAVTATATAVEEDDDDEEEEEEEEEVEATPEDLEYIGQIKRVLELLKKNRDMLYGEVKLTISIEDPREVERKRLLGIDDSDGPSREDLVAVLEEVNEGKTPRDRVALQMLAEEMTSWPNLEVEINKTKGKNKSLYAKATDTGVDPKVAAKRLNVDWDSAAEIQENETSDERDVPSILGFGALYLVTAFPVIIGISVVLILFYNSLQ